MPASTVSYGGFEIVASAQTNPLGAWVAAVSLKDSAGKVVELRPMTVQPEWLTEEEALRDAFEWGRRYVDHEFHTPETHSWIAERRRAEVWFRGVEEKSQGPEISV
ncbi:DUF6566 family protein [Paraburkholderia sp.]|jgi:hypothetical protein|uniref:DUF6566 family protein n=1 Tax=Paraburkholderia sp. TaxID=1926495 RepID=UPI002F42F729